MTYTSSDNVYAATGLGTGDVPVSDMTTFLGWADTEVDHVTGRTWNTAAQTATEFLDGADFFRYDADQGHQFREWETPREFDSIIVSRQNLSTLSGLVFLNKDGTTSTTVQATDVVTNTEAFSQGELVLENNTVPYGRGNIRVIYTYGFDSSDARYNLVVELATILTGIRCFIAVSGGTFDDVTSFTLGSKTVSLGEPYINIREAISQFQKRKADILALLGERFNFAVI